MNNPIMAEKKTAGGRKIPVMNPQGTDGEMLGELCRVTLKYFLKEVDHHTGLIADKTKAR